MADDNRGGEPIRAPDEAGNWSTIKQIAGALKVHLNSLLAGEDQFLNGIAVFAAGSEYAAGSAASDAGNITLGALGAAGDLLTSLTIRLASVGGTCTTKILDGSAELEAYTIVTQADNTTQTIIINGGLGLRSKNGGWRINCDISAGTIGNVKYVAAGNFT